MKRPAHRTGAGLPLVVPIHGHQGTAVRRCRSSATRRPGRRGRPHDKPTAEPCPCAADAARTNGSGLYAPQTSTGQGRKVRGRHAALQRAAAGFTPRWTTTSTPTWTTVSRTTTTPWTTASSAPKCRGAHLPAGKRSNPPRSRGRDGVRLYSSDTGARNDCQTR